VQQFVKAHGKVPGLAAEMWTKIGGCENSVGARIYFVEEGVLSYLARSIYWVARLFLMGI